MTAMQLDTLTIVGVGLIGGSVGLAAKKRGLAKLVRGLGRPQDGLDQALQRGAIDQICWDPVTAATAADLIVVCTPVDQVADQVLALAKHCRAGTVLTDVGSTKASIVASVETSLSGQRVHFVGSHPLSGSEKHGAQHADSDLFLNRLTIVTRTPRTDATALERVADFWRGIGAHVHIMAPADHDRALALTSHLPHLLAAALAGVLPSDWHELTAGGFRDSTRIAAGDPALWTAIFSHNRRPLLDALHMVEERLGQFRQALEGEDQQTVHDLLHQAKRVRDSL